MFTAKKRLIALLVAATPASGAVVALSALLLLSLASGKSASAEEAKDSCVECHGKTSYLVTNRKLYSYFQRWRSSNHTRGGVTCVDCHGGNPQSSDKEKAHGADPAATKPFLRDIDAHLRNLKVTWHTFDLDLMSEKTEAVLEELRAKREEVASAARENDLANRGQSPR